MWRSAVLAMAAAAMPAAAGAATLEGGLGLDASTTFHDNYLKLGDGEATPAGMSRDDLVTTVAASAEGALRFGEQKLFLGGTVGIHRYLENSQFDNESFAVAGGLQWVAGPRCGGTLELSARRSQIEQEDVIGVVDGTKLAYGASASGECGIAADFFAGLEAGYTITDTDIDSTTDGSRVSDGRSWSVKGRLGYRNEPLSKLGIYVGYGEWTTDAVDAAAGDDQTRRVSIGVAGSYQLGPKTTVSAEVGGAHVFDSLGDDFTTIVMDARVTWQPTPKLTVEAGVARDVDASTDVAASYLVSQTVRASVDWAVLPAVGVGVWTAYGTRDYGASDELQGLAEDYDSRVWSTGVHGSYHVSEHVDITLAYTFQDSDASLDADDYDAHQVMIGVGLKY